MKAENHDDDVMDSINKIIMDVVKIFLKAMVESPKVLDRYQAKLDEFLSRAKNGEIIELEDVLREIIADEKKVKNQKEGSQFYIPGRQKNHDN
jgi:hypothetical protein